MSEPLEDNVEEGMIYSVDLTAEIVQRVIETVPVVRLHLPDYNEAAWEVEGKDLYPQFKSYEEYREAHRRQHGRPTK